MNDFDKTWSSYPWLITHKKPHDHQSTIIDMIKSSNKKVFVAKGRVGLVTKMFMQRLSQLGHSVAHSEDILVPRLDKNDLVIFVTASGNTASSLAYVDIAKKCNCKTLAITFNPEGKISKQCDVVCDFEQSDSQDNLMKSYYELGFIFIFERIISLMPEDQFVHTNFE